MNEARKKGKTERYDKKRELKACSKPLEGLVKRKDEDLEGSEERFKSVFVTSPSAIVITDLDAKIVECNQAALEMNGCKSKGELIGKNALELVAAKDRQRVLKDIEKALQQHSSKNIEYTLLTKSGREFPAELSASVVKDASGNPTSFVAIINDITVRKRMEEALTESERKYKSVIDNIGVGVAVISPRMEILSLNKQMKKWFPRVDPLKKPLCYRSFNNPPRKTLCSYCPTHKTLVDGRTHESITETPRGKKTVNYRIISTPILCGKNGKPVAAIEMVDDATERRQMEKRLKQHSERLERLVNKRTRKLRESEERFRDIAINAGEWIWEVDREGRYVYSSPAVEQILGYKADEVIGKFFYDFLLPDEREQLKHAAFEKFKKKEPFAHFVNRNMHKNGHTVVLETNGVPILDPGGQLLGYRGSDRDVTERRTVEDRLSTLNSYGGLLNSAHSLEEVYKLTLNAMELTLGFEHASFMTVERNCLRISCCGGYPKPLAFKLPLDGTKGGITVRAANTRKPVLVPDVRKDKDYIGTSLGMRSELAVPIVAEDKTLGVLNVESKETNAFTEREVVMLQILASHAATAINNLEKRKEIEVRSNQLSLLMNSSAEMIHSTDLNRRLQSIVNAICRLGWRRVVLSVRNENLDIERPEGIVTAGLTDKEREYLWINRQPGQVWTKRFGQEYQRFRIGEFYHLPWSDPWVRKKFSKGTVLSKLTQEDMVDWDPEDLLYAPLRLADGRIMGVVSMDDPSDGKRPAGESMQPLELFLNQAAVAIENAQLFEQLKAAKTQLQEHADQLEEKVEMKTEQLKETQSKLLKSERLAAIGELAGMVGHDLRNPLTGIAGATYYLRTRVDSKLGKKAEEMLCLIEKNIGHSNKIINDLLEYSREIRLDLTETTPRMIMKETLSLIKTPRRIRIVNATRTEPRIKVDEEKMRRVFINIIKNAFDAMPEGGTLKIKSKKLGDNIEFTFSDTGVGMPEETLQKLWTPLFTTKAKGMGFGLPICKRIVEAHGGRVTVDSTVGKGTTFKVTLSAVSKTVGGEKIWMNVPESLLSMTMKV